MSYKTDRLVALFPGAYAAGDRGSLLYKLLDAYGAELMAADAAVKRLLKSHWVEHAENDALDRLGAMFGVERRVLAGGGLEGDAAFRARLQSIVVLFTGGGTVEAIKGAVRSALGLPYNLDQLGLPPSYAALRRDIEALVQVHEFSPKIDRVVETAAVPVDLDARTRAAWMTVSVNASTVSESLPRIELQVDRGALGRLVVRCEDTGLGFRSDDAFVLGAGTRVVFSAAPDGRLSALVDGSELAAQFTGLDGSVPARMPPVPAAASLWRFQAQGSLYDLGRLDRAGFDLPDFRVAIERVVLQPLTFDVQVPFFLKRAVEDLQRLHGYPGEILVFEGIAPDRIQQVVDQTRAAGVRGAVQFALQFVENQAVRERFAIAGDGRWREGQDAADALAVANTNDADERHDVAERLTLAGVYDISRFDGPFGFL